MTRIHIIVGSLEYFIQESDLGGFGVWGNQCYSHSYTTLEDAIVDIFLDVNEIEASYAEDGIHHLAYWVKPEVEPTKTVALPNIDIPDGDIPF